MVLVICYSRNYVYIVTALDSNATRGFVRLLLGYYCTSHLNSKLGILGKSSEQERAQITSQSLGLELYHKVLDWKQDIYNTR